MTAAGVFFTERMTGELEAAPGAAARTRATLRAAVRIASLQDFLDDPLHGGTLDGAVRIDALSSDWLPARGDVKLFSMGRKPGERLMRYQVAFEFGGVRHTLAGDKYVHDDLGFDSWRDVTTLYTTVARDGVDGAEQKLWSGTLRLTLLQGARLMTTLRGTGGTGVLARLYAVWRFALFFLSEVGSIFLPMRARR